MGVTAAVPSSGPSPIEGVIAAEAFISPISIEVTGVFVLGALIFVLTYLNLHDESRLANDRIETLLAMSLLPLSVTFATILIFASLLAIQ